MSSETLDTGELAAPPSGGDLTPGLALVFAAGKPAVALIPLGDREIELGRDHPVFADRPDPRLSRRHASVRFEGGRFFVTDRGSRNGTSVDGEALKRGPAREATRVIRAGDALLVPMRDIRPLDRLGVRVVAGRVEGPALQGALLAVEDAARAGSVLHIAGESGAGKEGLARAFHARGPASGGPFISVNCASIPEDAVERLLFGAEKGSTSGADADADGYAQAAHGGTLFLDEIAELSLDVQAKLLRMLELGEVSPLGARGPRRVDVRFCTATHRDLRAQVAAGLLRGDLYSRIAAPRVVAPPLRDRPEEIPWLLHAEVARVAPSLALHVSFVEACLLRPWPGNVRELCAEARSAAQAARAVGSARVELRHLSRLAGSALPAALQPSGASK